MTETVKLLRLAQAARKRIAETERAGKDATAWRRLLHLIIRESHRAVTGETPLRTSAKHRVSLDSLTCSLSADGGPGSGNWGHEGRPGKRGGSAEGGGAHNRMTAEGGGFTSFSKIQKQYAKPHAFDPSSDQQVSWKQKGTKLVAGGTTYEYHPASDTFEGPDHTIYASSHFKGQEAKILVPNSASPNYSKAKASINIREAQKRFDAAFNPTSAEEADNAYRSKSGEVWRTCDQETKEALWFYTGAGYQSMNPALRAGNKGDSLTAAKIDRVTDAISKSKLDKDCILCRGVYVSGFEKMMKLPSGSLTPDKLQDLIGKHGIEDGFMSTGSAKGTGFSRAVRMEILAPKGTQAMYAEPFSMLGDGYGMNWDGVRNDGKSKQSNLSGELETIVQRASSLVILSGSYEHGKYHFKAMITGQNPK